MERDEKLAKQLKEYGLEFGQMPPGSSPKSFMSYDPTKIYLGIEDGVLWCDFLEKSESGNVKLKTENEKITSEGLKGVDLELPKTLDMNDTLLKQAVLDMLIARNKIQPKVKKEADLSDDDEMDADFKDFPSPPSPATQEIPTDLDCINGTYSVETEKKDGFLPQYANKCEDNAVSAFLSRYAKDLKQTFPEDQWEIADHSDKTSAVFDILCITTIRSTYQRQLEFPILSVL